MVMEVPPSPDSVGREFVRQYYTLLNKAPTHLHRFYNNQSSFVHGGLDPPNRATSPMIGQKQIHQKIQQLNFRDCHAKISQVDAQATLGNGVVVQVTGELSNAGQPMRRFTQTFVLAAQSPKKYYVHNDIFRYQDEIISDEECEQDSRSDMEEEINNQERPMPEVQPIQQQAISYYSPNAAPLQGAMPPAPHHHAQPPPPHVIATQPAPAINGAVHPEEMNMIQGQVPAHVTPTPAPGIGPALAALQPTVTPAPIPAPVPVEETQQPEEEAVIEPPVENNYNEEPIIESEVTDNAQEIISHNEPKTYATLLKSGGNTGGFGSSAIGSVHPAKTLSPPPSNKFDHRDPQNSPTEGMMGQRNNINRTNKPPQRMPKDSRGPGRHSMNDNDNEGSFEERRRSQGNSFGDSNQLFLGSLPHSATEEELRDIFSQFGPIVELKINNKANSKTGPPGSRAPLNYAFITFENIQAVQNCLAAKGIYYPKDDKNGTRLNVQEKKTKDRPPYGGGVGGRPSMDNNSGPRPRDNGQRRGPPGGGPGQPRGGGNMTGNGSRPNSFNRGPPNRGPNNTFNARR